MYVFVLCITRGVRSLPSASQVAAVKVPVLQLDVPDTVYPASQVGWHVEPLASMAVHVPAAPLVGAAEASQAAKAYIVSISMHPQAYMIGQCQDP